MKGGGSPTKRGWKKFTGGRSSRGGHFSSWKGRRGVKVRGGAVRGVRGARGSREQ